MARHIFTGSGAPTLTPTAVGQHYIDMTNKVSYISVGTASSADWSISDTASAIATHIADSDPHPQYLTPAEANAVYDPLGDAAAAQAFAIQRANHTGTQVAATISDFNSAADARIAAQKGAASGLATLDGGGKIPQSQIPAVAITDTFTVASQAAMLALTCETGDIAVRTDLNKTFILKGANPATLGDWQELLTPTDQVQSVNGQSGVVVLTKSDVGLSNADNTSDLLKPISNATQSALDSKQDKSASNYALNPGAEVDLSDVAIYDDAGRTDPAFVVEQDLTFTAVAAGNAGNGIEVRYIFHASQSYLTPLITVVSPVLVTVAWYNGPTVANNPTATQLKAAWDAEPGAVALATCAISGTSTRKQYITGGHFLANGGDSAPVDGAGGSPANLSLTRSTVAPLTGLASFLLTKAAASAQGSGFSTDFQISNADLGDYIQVSLDFLGSTNLAVGNAGDLKFFIYDITNNVFIPTNSVNYLTGAAGSSHRYAVNFTASMTSTNYRLCIHVATANALAWTFQFDSITISNVIDAVAATQVPQLRLPAQPILVSVTDLMAVMWQDGNTSWRPATMAAGADATTLFGFATNIVGLTADIILHGALSGFSIGPFLGYNQYVDNTAGGISPLPSPFTDTGVVMGKGISSDTMLVNPRTFTRLITSKGGLLSNAGANNGTGDQVLAAGANGNVLVANSAAALGINWAAAVVVSAPFTYTLATRTLTCAVATDSVAGVLSAADHTTYTGYGTTLALKAPIASPTFTGTPAAPTAAPGTSTTQLATTAFVTTADNLKAPLASPAFTGTPTVAGDVQITTIGKGVQVKTGTNAKIGTATLVAGTVTVANTSVTANSRIFVCSNTDGGTPGWLRVSAKTNGTSFVITSSSATDTSTVAWYIVESIP